jgi:hypothetical protein
MAKKESDRHCLRGPCPISDVDWVLMKAGSILAAAIRPLVPEEKAGTEDQKEKLGHEDE